MDLSTPPPDLYGRPRADAFIRRLTAFGDRYSPALGAPLLRRNPRRPLSRPTPPLQLVIAARRQLAPDVVELAFADPSGGPLPPWQPGAHLRLALPSGRERHYSLSGDPADRHRYRIAVRRLPEGGGGSVEVHDTLHPGARLTARRPRNGFAFCAEPAVLLLAGGIGITPLLPMAREAQRHGLDWRLVHVGRSADTLPYTDELRALDPHRVVLRTDDEHGGVPTGPELLAHAPRGAAVYCCGPAPMLAAVQRSLDGSPATALHFERFGAAPVTDGEPFAVRLGADGPTLDVPADRSALDVLREARPDLPYSCHQGFCGTCEVRLLAGRPDHRDRRLTPEQRAAGALLPCVSRAAEGETLVLDIWKESPSMPPTAPTVKAAPAFPYTERDLARFRETQQLAYHCAEQVAAWIEPGVTERQATAELRRRLVAAGVQDFFHVPFAWFGDRTAFRHFHTPLQFFAGNRRLEEGMPYVLDCAPIVDGYTADIGYGGKIGENRVWDRLAADLKVYRELILAEVRARRPLDEVYAAVDAQIAAHGYDNRHQVYPGRVIGHQVTRTTVRGPAGVNVFGFGVRTLQTLARELISERLHGRSPLWADGRSSRHVPTPGLWAVEPHIGFRGVGIKFEELLVVTEDDAYWLDDDLPHVRRWTAATAATTEPTAERTTLEATR